MFTLSGLTAGLALLVAGHVQAQAQTIESLKQMKLIPVEEASHDHHARTCRVGPDGMLYSTLGQPYDGQPRSEIDLFKKVGIGGIVRMDPSSGARREVYATGIRNSVGLEFNPKDKTLWFTVNQTDGMGDLIPEGEINRATKAGQFLATPGSKARPASPKRATTTTHCRPTSPMHRC